MLYQYMLNIEKIKVFSDIDYLLDYISVERQEKIMRFRFDKDKIHSIMAEILLRYALKEQYPLKDIVVKFSYSDNQKPMLDGANDIHFNISHSGDWVVCVVGDKELGVDVEEIQDNIMEDVCSCFSAKEIEYLYHCSGSHKVNMFYKLWTLKESFVKYTGNGLSQEFDKFYFIVDGQEVRLIQDGEVRSDLKFLSWKIDEKHWYALCSECNSSMSYVRNVKLDDLKNIMNF